MRLSGMVDITIRRSFAWIRRTVDQRNRGRTCWLSLDRCAAAAAVCAQMQVSASAELKAASGDICRSLSVAYSVCPYSAAAPPPELFDFKIM